VREGFSGEERMININAKMRVGSKVQLIKGWEDPILKKNFERGSKGYVQYLHPETCDIVIQNQILSNVPYSFIQEISRRGEMKIAEFEKRGDSLSSGWDNWSIIKAEDGTIIQTDSGGKWKVKDRYGDVEAKLIDYDNFLKSQGISPTTWEGAKAMERWLNQNYFPHRSKFSKWLKKEGFMEFDIESYKEKAKRMIKNLLSRAPKTEEELQGMFLSYAVRKDINVEDFIDAWEELEEKGEIVKKEDGKFYLGTQWSFK